MVNPNKAERNFLSRMFRTISLYMLVALCSFFGYIMIVGDVTISFELPENSASADENSNLTALMENVMSANSVESDFNVEVNGQDISLSVQGNVMVDIKNFDFQLTSQIVMNQETYLVNAFKNEDSFVYFSVNDLSYKLDTTEVENFDFSSLLPYLQSNVDTDALLEFLSRYTGVDFANLDLNSLMTELSIKENNVEEGHRFTISLGSLIVTIDCDENFNNISLTLREINYGGYNIKASVDTVELNREDFALNLTPTGEETDITSLLQLVENAKLNENTYALSSDLTISVDDMVVNGDVMAMLVQNGNELVPYVRFKMNEFKGFKGYIYLIDNTVYLNAQNLLLKFDINELNEDKLTEIEGVLKDFGIDLDAVETVSVILPTLENIKLTLLESGLQVVVDDVVIGDKLSLNNINLSVNLTNADDVILPRSAEILATLTDLESKENKDVKILFDNIKIGKSTQNLDDITFEEDEIFLQTNLDKKELNEFADIAPLTSIITNALGTKTLQGNVNLQVSKGEFKVDLTGFVKFDLDSLSVSAALTLKYENVSVDVKVYGFNLDKNHLIYISLGGEVFALDVDNLDFERLMKDYGISQPAVDAVDVIKDIISVDINNLDLVNLSNRLNLKEIENGYALTFDEKEIKINYNETFNIFNFDVSAISYEGYVVKVGLDNVEINASDFAIDFVPTGDETEISSILFIEEYARLNETEQETTYALSSDLSVSVDDMTLTGNILARLVKSESGLTPYLRVKINEFKGFKGYIYLIDNTVYLNAQNLLLKLDIDDLTEEKLSEIEEILTNFGVSMEEAEKFTLVLPTLSEISINWLENGINIATKNGLTINEQYNLSDISLSLITSNENDVILPEEVKVSATLNNLTNSEQNEFELTLSSVKLGKNSQHLEDIAFGENSISLQTNTGMTTTDKFMDAMKIFDLAKNVLETKNVQGNINLTIENGETKIDAEGVVKFDLNNMAVSADLTLNYNGLNVSLSVYGFNIDVNRTIYLTYDGRTFALNIDNIDLSSFMETNEEVDVTETVVNIIKDVLGIDINNVDIANLTNQIFLNEIENGYTITFNDKTITLNYNELFNVFSVDLSKISYNGFDVKVNLSDVEINASNFAIDYTPTGEETEISSMFKLLENAKLDENTYAFSGNLAVRYSTTSFYGNILAMLVESENGFVPYIRIYTSSMNLNTYIYLLDETIYLDLHGLRLTFNLSENSINEILAFVQENFGVEELNATVALSVILPKLSAITHGWSVDNGLQINISDNLYYTETSYFKDIVLQAFMAETDTQILPTGVVIGANIVDPNTEIYDDYSDYLLNGEKSVTSNKNFAVYIDNISIGKSADYQNSITFENGKVVSVVGFNDVSFDVEEFVDVHVLMDIVEKALSYINSNTFQLRIDATLQNGKNETRIGGDVILSITKAVKENEAETKVGFTLFGGKRLKLQADLTIENYAPQLDETTNEETMVRTSEHQISIYYDSNQVDENGYVQSDLGGLYISYTHDQNIGTNYFRGHIQNTDLNETDGTSQRADMSDMIALILNFANIDIGEEAMESWQLEENTTDFSFLQKLLGIGGNDLSDDITQTDQILGDVSSILAMIDSISFNKNEQNVYELAVGVDLGDNVAEIGVVFDENNNLSIINAGNIAFENNNITAKIEVQDYNEANFDYNMSNPHFDLSNIPEFLDIAVNTLNTKHFNYKGNATVKLNVLGLDLIKLNIGIDLETTISDEGEISFFAEIDVPCVMIATYNSGLMGNTYTTDWRFDYRRSTIRFENNVLSINQYTYKRWFTSEKISDLNWSYNSDEIGANIMLIMAQTLGLTDKVYDGIAGLIENLSPAPSLEKTLLGFEVLSSEEGITTGYNLVLDGYTLTGDDNFGDMNVGIGVSNSYEDKYRFIESVTANLNIADGIVLIDLNLNSYYPDSNGDGVTDDYYTTNGGHTIYTNEYYRQQYISSIGTFKN